MTVEDVFKPKTVNAVNPKVAEEKNDGDTSYWQQKAKDAKARLDYEEYVNAMRKLGETPEPPFKVKGEINLGSYNPQEQQEKAQERMDKALKDKDNKLDEERKRADGAEQRLHDQKIESIRQDFDHKLDELNKTIEKIASANRKDERPVHEQFRDQFTALQTLAKELGFEKTSTGQDPMVQLELAKLTYQQAKEDREFKWKMRQDEKNFQLQLKQMDKDDMYRNATLAQQARKDEMIASFPQQIGAALAKGVLENKGGATRQGNTIQGQQTPTKPYHLEAPEGESGEVDCPTCQARGKPTKVGIGSDTTSAECAWCGSKFTITRIPITGSPSELLPVDEEQE